MRELGTKCLRRLVFPNSSDANRFVSEFFQSEAGKSNRFYLKAGSRRADEVDPPADYDITIHAIDPIPGNHSTDAKRLDVSFLDGMLRYWKGNLVQLEDCAPAA